MHIYLSLYIQLETRRWPNALNMQRLVESALGYQRVTLGLTVALATVRDGSGDGRPAKRLFGLEEGGAGGAAGVARRQDGVQRVWGAAAWSGGQVLLACLLLSKLYTHI